jgi:hypothetical protein
MLSFTRNLPGIRAVAVAVILMFASAISPASAAEVREDESGFHLGLKLLASSLHTDNDDDEEFYIKDDGGGLQLDVGYRFNPTFMLEVSLGGANHESSDPGIDAWLQVVQILGYYRFSPDRAFRPFIKGGLGGHALRVEEGSAHWTVEGGGVVLGGGFRYFFSSYFSLGLDITHNIIKYDRATIGVEGFSYEWDIDEDGSMTSLGVLFGYSF